MIPTTYNNNSIARDLVSPNAGADATLTTATPCATTTTTTAIATTVAYKKHNLFVNVDRNLNKVLLDNNNQVQSTCNDDDIDNCFNKLLNNNTHDIADFLPNTAEINLIGKTPDFPAVVTTPFSFGASFSAFFNNNNNNNNATTLDENVPTIKTLEPEIKPAATKTHTFATKRTITTTTTALLNTNGAENTKKVVLSSNYVSDFVDTPSRHWRITYLDADIVGTGVTAQILAKTRRDKPCKAIPMNLYSSLQYEIRQTIHIPRADGATLFLSKISVRNAETGEPAFNRNGACPLKSITEVALVADGTNQCTYKASFILKFNKISYYHNNQELYLVINYYLPEDLERTVLTVRSSDFRVYARKPSTKTGKAKKKCTKKKKKKKQQKKTIKKNTTATKKVAKKRKRTTTTTTSTARVAHETDAKKPKTQLKTSVVVGNFAHFVTQLDDLVQQLNKLDKSEREIALDLIRVKFKTNHRENVWLNQTLNWVKAAELTPTNFLK